jgi:hypothetical protein
MGRLINDSKASNISTKIIILYVLSTLQIPVQEACVGDSRIPTTWFKAVLCERILLAASNAIGRES